MVPKISIDVLESQLIKVSNKPKYVINRKKFDRFDRLHPVISKQLTLKRSLMQWPSVS